MLAPGGWFGLIFNNRDVAVEWVKRLDAEIIDPLFPPNVPRQQTGEFKKVFDDQSLFSPLQHHQYRYVQEGGAEMVVGRVLSQSVVTPRPAEEKEDIRRRILALLAEYPDQWSTMEAVALPYVTDVYMAQRL